jgi:hypothetical protein
MIGVLLPAGLGLVRGAAASGNCDPPSVSWPKWVPHDLPLPKGTYAIRKFRPDRGYKHARFRLPIGVHRFARFVFHRWPKHGWYLGRGDSEAGEVEDEFSRSPAVGFFKARRLECKTVLDLYFNKG